MSSRVEIETISSLVKAASYAVRGPIVARSLQLDKQLKEGAKLPFKSIIACNIGNPHALNQKSLTFIRDVLSIVVNPSLAQRCSFPDDVVKRAQKYINSVPDIGAYTDSQGIATVREEVCQFLEERDSYKADPSSIFLTNGASDGVRLCLQTIIRSETTGAKDGILTPIPQYPLYSALSTLLNAELVPYYLDEKHGWECTVENLTKSLAAAKAKGINTRALVVINPGNPTGQLLSEEAIKSIIAWCQENNILLMADEVYQDNIWKANSKFVSFRKCAYDMQAFDAKEKALQLISFHSISKGFLGECGFRGGYFELLGLDEAVKAQIYKLSSISLCSNTVGQVATGIMVNPPKPGEPSFELYNQEKEEILTSLTRRASKMSAALNQLEGVSCNAIDGAMYAFPTITLPAKAIEVAASRGVAADALYALELLENTGIVVVPGSGFGQEEGTYHFRTTILPPEEKIDEVIELLKVFHADFLARYA